MRISDWSSDVCSSDLPQILLVPALLVEARQSRRADEDPAGEALFAPGHEAVVKFPHAIERDLAHCPARRIDHVAADRRHRLAEAILRRAGREHPIDAGAEMIERRFPLALVLSVVEVRIGR